jgi:hypothetical protein
LIEEP